MLTSTTDPGAEVMHGMYSPSAKINKKKQWCIKQKTKNKFALNTGQFFFCFFIETEYCSIGVYTICNNVNRI